VPQIAGELVDKFSILSRIADEDSMACTHPALISEPGARTEEHVSGTQNVASLDEALVLCGSI
jgi:hypothetical protein